MKRAWTMFRLRLAWLIMPPEIKSIALKPELPGEAQARKKPTPLWLNRREALLKFGYDPRDTATP